MIYTHEANEIFNNFYFYYTLIFDNEINLLRDAQERIKHKITTLKEKKQKLEKEVSQAEKNTAKFQAVLNETYGHEVIKVLAKSISLNENKKFTVQSELEKTNYDLDKLDEKLKKSKKELDFYDMKERSQNWFFKVSVEEQRDALVKIINKGVLYNHYLVIEAGQVVFLFDAKADYNFDLKMIDGMNKDEISKSKIKELSVNEKLENYGGYKIFKISLSNEKTRAIATKFLSGKFGIIHNFDKIANLVSFVDLRELVTAAAG